MPMPHPIADDGLRVGTSSDVFYRSPGDRYPVMVRGSGCYLWDAEEHRVLDMVGGLASVSLLGYGREDIADALRAQALQLSFVHNSRVSNDRQEELATLLLSMCDLDSGRVMFTSGGSEANELALR